MFLMSRSQRFIRWWHFKNKVKPKKLLIFILLDIQAN